MIKAKRDKDKNSNMPWVIPGIPGLCECMCRPIQSKTATSMAVNRKFNEAIVLNCILFILCCIFIVWIKSKLISGARTNFIHFSCVCVIIIKYINMILLSSCVYKSFTYTNKQYLNSTVCVSVWLYYFFAYVLWN